MAEERDKNFSNSDLMPAFGLELSEGEIKVKINQTLNKRMNLKTGGGRRVQQEETICSGGEILTALRANSARH